MKHSLSLYIAEYTRLVPKTEKLSAANQNRVLRHPSQTPFNFVSQSESSTTSTKPSANQNRALCHPSRALRHPRALGYGWRPFSALVSNRLAIAYLKTQGLQPPPPHLSSSHSYYCNKIGYSSAQCITIGYCSSM